MTEPSQWLDPYLARLGVADPGEPSRDGLFALHRAQVERIAYENLDIQLGRPQGIDPAESIRRILAGRGGYCFNLNGALATLLAALGYDVTWHRGGVHGEAVPYPDEYGNHLAVTVDLDGETWMVDAGLGNAHHEPMLLAEGEHRQGPFAFRLDQVAAPDGTAVWRFAQDPSMATNSFLAMDFSPAPARWTDFLPKHVELSTSPTSSFVKALQVYRRDARGVDNLLGCMLHRYEGGDAHTERELSSSAEWFDAMTDLFGLNLAALGDDDRERLWKRVRTSHEEWLAARAAAGGSSGSSTDAVSDGAVSDGADSGSVASGHDVEDA
jgi:N-hydroxyarylamine O-acetyltransferase